MSVTSKCFQVYIIYILIYGLTACVPHESTTDYPATPTPKRYPTPTEFPILVNPTQTATIPPPIIIVLQNGRHQVTLPIIGLTFSYSPSKVIEARIESNYVFLLFDIYRQTGLHINIERDNCPKFDPLFTPAPGSDLMVPIDLNGAPALRRPLNDDIWVVYVYVARGSDCVIIDAIAGEGDGEIIYEDSIRQKTLVYFDEILATFQFAP